VLVAEKEHCPGKFSPFLGQIGVLLLAGLALTKKNFKNHLGMGDLDDQQ
jgi:hypothetical protein